MYKLLLFAGTTEGRELAEYLAGCKVQVTACVATEYGETLISPQTNLTVHAGRMDRQQMQQPEMQSHRNRRQKRHPQKRHQQTLSKEAQIWV